MTTTATLREAAQQALEALEHATTIIDGAIYCGHELNEAGIKKRAAINFRITALRAALAEQAEPVPWECKAGGLKKLTQSQYDRQSDAIKRHYSRVDGTAPERKPLTDAQIAATYKQLTDKARQTGNPKFGSVLSLARAVERAHGITAAPAEGGAA